MRNQQKLLIEQMDKKFLPFVEAEKINMPSGGWINGIRITLNMTMEQLGRRLGITRQGVRRIETSEASGAISLKLLKEVGMALEMKLVYGFVPKNGTLEAFIDQKAYKLATQIVLRTNQTMMLESQSTDREHIDRAIIELAGEIKQEMNRSLWD